MSIPSPVLVFALAVEMSGGSPVVADLHTVSVHVDSVAKYNALLRLWSGDLQWPLLYGKPLTEDDKGRRNYAGIWAGNIRLEICGPYPLEFESRENGARLHGLTFHPYASADKSAAELDRRHIRRRPIATWGTQESPVKLVSFNDPDMNAPRFSVSIMHAMNRKVEESDRARAQPKLAANRGGPLGLKQVREIHVTYPHAASLDKWQGLLEIDSEWWSGGDGPSLRFMKNTKSGIAAAVLKVRSLDEAGRVLAGLGFKVARTEGRIECNMSGVQFVFVQ